MKPLPTLTKPLRSVDIATREPAQALRERTDSCRRARRRRGGGGDAGDRARRRLPRQVRRRPHRRRARGAAAYEERIGWKRRRSDAGRPLVFIGFMGAGKTSAARAVGAALGVRAGRLRPRARAAARQLDRGLLRRATASARSARSRRRRRARAARARRRRRCSRSAAARSPRGACATRSPRHTVVLLDVDADDRLAARRRRGARWRATASASTRCTPSARRSTRRSPTRCCPTRRRETRAPRGRRAAGAGRRARRDEAAVGAAASGDYPVLRRRRPARRRLLAAAPAGASSSPTSTSARSTPTALGDVAADVRIPPGEAAKTLGDAETVLRALAPPGWTTTTTWSRSAAAWSATSPGFCAARLPARGAGRAGADHARRAGRLGLRRQDRRRPARGQELRRAPTTSRRPCSPTRARSRRCRRRSSPRAGPRWSRRR